jgi:excisionase family DNA binding protein
MEQDKLTITIDEAAKMLGVGRNFMLEIIKMENFPAVKFNRKILINKEQFISWFNSLTEYKLHIAKYQ